MQNRPMLLRHNCLHSIKKSELIVLKNFLIAKSNMIPFIVSLKYFRRIFFLRASIIDNCCGVQALPMDGQMGSPEGPRRLRCY